MGYKRIFCTCFFFICASCAIFRVDPVDVIKSLQTENCQPIKTKNPGQSLKKLESQLQRILELKDKEMHRDWLPVLFGAISRYQFYFFVKPSNERFYKLKNYYRFIDNHKCPPPGNNFQDLRGLILEVDRRSLAAEKHLEKLLEYWQRHPKKRRKFMEKLKAPEEVGGIIFYSAKNGISYEFLEDSHREKYRKYLEEFKKNDFKNIEALKKAFLRRLNLHKVRNDSTSRNYADSISTAARYHFKQLRSFKNSSPPFSKASLAKIEKSKKSLLFLGLERLLLRQTYFFDRKPYLYRSDTAFFFHSHPYKAKYPYPKPPSGQDEEMTLRTGPSLVFDVRKNSVVVFAVVLGESSRVYRYLGKRY